MVGWKGGIKIMASYWTSVEQAVIKLFTRLLSLLQHKINNEEMPESKVKYIP
jgi:hypothetical protein